MATASTGLEAIVNSLALEATGRDIPSEVIDAAARATRSALAGQGCGPRMRKRAEAYFTAVVHRRLVSHHGGSPAAARVVAETVVSDLLRAGHSAQAALCELERGWKTRLPAAVIEEYRTRLCA